jgi:hypothetical protein
VGVISKRWVDRCRIGEERDGESREPFSQAIVLDPRFRGKSGRAGNATRGNSSGTRKGLFDDLEIIRISRTLLGSDSSRTTNRGVVPQHLEIRRHRRQLQLLGLLRRRGGSNCR